MAESEKSFNEIGKMKGDDDPRNTEKKSEHELAGSGNKAVFGCWKSFSGKYIFSGNANFRKRKMYLGVWLFRKSFYEKSIPVFDSSKYFTEIVYYNSELHSLFNNG